MQVDPTPELARVIPLPVRQPPATADDAASSEPAPVAEIRHERLPWSLDETLLEMFAEEAHDDHAANLHTCDASEMETLIDPLAAYRAGALACARGLAELGFAAPRVA